MRSQLTVTSLFGFFLAFLVMALLAGALVVMALFMRVPEQVHGIGMLLIKGEIGQVTSPVEALVKEWHREEGDFIEVGDPLVTLVSIKDGAPVVISAHAQGELAEIVAFPQMHVQVGAPLALTTKRGGSHEIEVLGFISSLDGKKVKKDMPATISPGITTPLQSGELLGQVRYVSKLPFAKSGLQSLIKLPELADYFRQQLTGEPYVVKIALKPDAHSKSGFAWNGPGVNFALDPGIIAEFAIVYDQPRLMELMFPPLWRALGDF